MSDLGFTNGVESAPESAGVTAGMMMRQAREAAGLHVAALAVAMKIPVKKLEALEADRLDLLHDAVFVRALASSVCRALKIDPAPILSRLPLNAAPKLNPDERGINAPFHTPSNTSGVPIPELLSKPSSLLVLVLVVAGLAVFFFPDIKVSDVASELSSPAPQAAEIPGPSQTTPSPSPAFEPIPAPVVATASLPVAVEAVPLAVKPAVSAPASGGIDVAAVKASTPTGALVAASQALAGASRPVAAASRPVVASSQPVVAASRPASVPALPTTGTVVFKANGTTWVKVVDAKGTVQLSKTLAEGEVVGASGAMPLSVVVGRADATQVEVRGQAFSLAAISKENVARFEVK